MLLFDGALGVIAVGVWIFCIIDVITTPEDQIRNLPKLLWLVIVVLMLDVGSIAWLVAGHPWVPAQARAAGRVGGAGERERVSQSARPSNPDDDEDFLAGLKARAEEQRRRAREATGSDEPPAADPTG